MWDNGEMHDAWLSAQGWEIADIEANRAGAMSANQARRIRHRMARMAWVRALWFLPAIPANLIALGVFRQHHDANAFVLPGSLAVALLPVIGGTLIRALRVRRDVAHAEVSAVTGIVEKNYIVQAPNWTCVTSIGSIHLRSYGPNSDKTWERTSQLLNNAPRGTLWCAYYLPRTQLLVAAEPGKAGSGWYPDPSGRHQWRVFDGTAWTGDVADYGVTGWDPIAVGNG